MLERTRSLAKLLAAPKGPNFRSLTCDDLAFDTGGERVAFIFQLPSSPSSPRPIQSLRGMFDLSPGVTERIKLALQLVQTLHWFHTAGWLHKDLRSEHILFLPSKKSSLLANPVFARFGFARADTACAISEQPSSYSQNDIYQHPDAMGEPSVSFTAEKDIYSLGTILLEIGEWRSLKSLVDKIVDVARADVQLIQLAQIRPFLLDDSPKGELNMLRFRMGDVYTGVVRVMLSGEVPHQWIGSQNLCDLRRPGVLDIATRELRSCVI